MDVSARPRNRSNAVGQDQEHSSEASWHADHRVKENSPSTNAESSCITVACEHDLAYIVHPGDAVRKSEALPPSDSASAVYEEPRVAQEAAR